LEVCAGIAPGQGKEVKDIKRKGRKLEKNGDEDQKEDLCKAQKNIVSGSVKGASARKRRYAEGTKSTTQEQCEKT